MRLMGESTQEVKLSGSFILIYLTSTSLLILVSFHLYIPFHVHMIHQMIFGTQIYDVVLQQTQQLEDIIC